MAIDSTTAPRSNAVRAEGIDRPRPARHRGRQPGAPRTVAYLYLLPGFVLFALFVIIPVVHTGWLSLFDWDGVGPSTWVGLKNYEAVFADPAIWRMFGHSGVLIVFYAFVPIILALFLTGLMSRGRVRGLTAYRAILFVPQVVSLIVVAIAWQWMYANDGIVNDVLGWFGVPTTAWLGDFTFALLAVALIGTWLMTGLCMVLFLSGVQKIDPELYDAAKVDGAGAFRQFTTVTLPGLRGEISVALTITVIAALRSFDLVYVLTKGGPGDATSVPGLEIYQRAFERSQVGSASAVAVVLALLILMVTYAIGRLTRRPE